MLDLDDDPDASEPCVDYAQDVITNTKSMTMSSILPTTATSYGLMEK